MFCVEDFVCFLCVGANASVYVVSCGCFVCVSCGYYVSILNFFFSI
jgi:hypothetical protein